MDITQAGLTALVLISALSGIVVGSSSAFIFFSRLVKDQKATDATEKLLAMLVPETTLKEVSTLASQGMALADKYGEQSVQTTRDFLTFVRNITDMEPNILEVTDEENS